MKWNNIFKRLAKSLIFHLIDPITRMSTLIGSEIKRNLHVQTDQLSYRADIQ